MQITKASQLIGVFPALFILLKNDESKNLRSSIDYMNSYIIVFASAGGDCIRKSIKIIEEVLNINKEEDVAFDSPSGAGAFVIGSTCNGWSNWKCEDGSNLKKFRK